MIETNDRFRNAVVTALFCTIIGIIGYAGFDSITAGVKMRSFFAAPKMPVMAEPQVHPLP